MASQTQLRKAPPTAPALDAADLAALSLLLHEDAAATRGRLAARERYLAAALPDRVQHLWRFSDPGQLLPLTLLDRERLPAASRPALPATLRPRPVAGAAATVDLWPGQAAVVQLAEGTPAAALTVAAPRPEADAREGESGSVLFRHLSDAAWNTGARLEVAPGTVLTGPIHVRVHACAPTTLPRLQITLGERAEAVVVEEHLDGGADVRVVGRTALVVGQAARLRHVVVQTWDEGTHGHLTVAGRAGRDADLLTVFASFGGARCKLELGVDLAGEGARSEMIGVALATGDQRFDHHTRHRHLAGRTWSNIDFKAVAGGTARSSYTGLIRIETDARDCEAFQENRNLLLSSGSCVDAIPELEIHNQDVSCSHGATVAPVDPEQLFYLESRGLDPQQALRTVVRGFLEKTLSRLPASLAPALEELAVGRLAALRKDPA